MVNLWFWLKEMCFLTINVYSSELSAFAVLTNCTEGVKITLHLFYEAKANLSKLTHAHFHRSLGDSLVRLPVK